MHRMMPGQRVKVIRPISYVDLMVRTFDSLGLEPYSAWLAAAVQRRAGGRDAATLQDQAATGRAQRKPCGGLRGEAIAALHTRLYERGDELRVHPAAVGKLAVEESKSGEEESKGDGDAHQTHLCGGEPHTAHPAWTGELPDLRPTWSQPSLSPVLGMGPGPIRRNSGPFWNTPCPPAWKRFIIINLRLEAR